MTLIQDLNEGHSDHTPQTIENTIKSVVNQTYLNFEYIVIDGGSTDGTIDIIERYRDRINFFKSEPDKGIFDAMNKGLLLAKGEWISFMNSGDMFYTLDIIKEVFSKDNLSVNKDSNYDKDKTFPSEHKDKTKKTDSEIEFNTYHGEDENFISALKNKAKELASKVVLIDDESTNHDEDKGMVSTIKDKAKELAAKVEVTNDKTDDDLRKSKKDNQQ